MTPRPRTPGRHPLPAHDSDPTDSDPTDQAPRVDAGRDRADAQHVQQARAAGGGAVRHPRHVELELGAAAHGGHVVGRTPEGRVVFVRHGAPGERVRVRLTEAGESARYWRGDAVEVLRPDPRRRPAHPWAPADAIGAWAQGRPPVGGAEFGHLQLPLQRELKTGVLRELLARIGNLAPEQIEALDPRVGPLPGEDPQGLGWRTRAHFAVDDDGRPAMHPHRSAELIPVEDFPLMVEPLRRLRLGDLDWTGAARVDLIAASAQAPLVLVTARAMDTAAFEALAERLRREAVPALQGPAGAGEPVRDGEAAGAGETAGVSLLLAPDPATGRRAPVVLSGRDHGTEQIGARCWEVSAGGFWQIHRAAPGHLLHRVTEAARPAPGETVLDLYSGAGLLTAGLAEAVGPTGRVLAVEGSPLTSADAAANLAELEQVEAVRGSVEQILAQRWPGSVRPDPRGARSRRGPGGGRTRRGSGGRAQYDRRTPQGAGSGGTAAGRPDVVVLDPPRAGAGRTVVDAIAALEPRRVVYLSCDPATLARDLARFRHQGWQVRSVDGMDLYPNTHHLETLAVLERD